MNEKFDIENALKITLSDMLRQTTDFVGIAKKDSSVYFINKAGREMVGLSENAPLVGYTIFDFHPKFVWSDFKEIITPDASKNGVWVGKTYLQNIKSKEIIPVSAVKITHYDSSGNVDFYSTIMRDISNETKVLKELEILSTFPAQSPFPMMRVDNNGRILYANNASLDLMRYWGVNVGDNIPAKDFDIRSISSLDCDIVKKELYFGDRCFYLNLSPEPNGKFTNIYAADISEQKQYEKKLEFTSLHDELTGLPSRLLLEETFKQKVGHNKRQRESFAFLYIDVDDFKNINDNFGHEAGDKVLKILANTLQSILRKTDFVARVGGDEFVILVDGDVKSKVSVEIIIKKIQEAFKKVLIGNSNKITVTLSIGVYYYKYYDTASIDKVMRLSDNAMYHVKNNKKNNYHFAN